MNEGIVLGYHIYFCGIEVNPTKVTIIHQITTPHKQKYVMGFLGHLGYCKRFIKYFSNIAVLLFTLLS